MGLLIAPNKESVLIPSWVNGLWITLLFIALILLVVLGKNKSHREARGNRISKATENQNQEVTGTGSYHEPCERALKLPFRPAKPLDQTTTLMTS